MVKSTPKKKVRVERTSVEPGSAADKIFGPAPTPKSELIRIAKEPRPFRGIETAQLAISYAPAKTYGKARKVSKTRRKYRKRRFKPRRTRRRYKTRYRRRKSYFPRWFF
jgi:hypothetical protein